MNTYLYAGFIGGAVGMLGVWSKFGWSRLFDENHPYQVLITAFVVCGLGTAGIAWLLAAS